MPSEYVDDAYCGHCERETRHRFKDSGHERDSSNDHRECLVCGWHVFGMFGTYVAPNDIDVDGRCGCGFKTDSLNELTAHACMNSDNRARDPKGP